MSEFSCYLDCHSCRSFPTLSLTDTSKSYPLHHDRNRKKGSNFLPYCSHFLSNSVLYANDQRPPNTHETSALSSDPWQACSAFDCRQFPLRRRLMNTGADVNVVHWRRTHPARILVRGGLSPKFAQNRGFSLTFAWKLHDFEKIMGARGARAPTWSASATDRYGDPSPSHPTPPREVNAIDVCQINNLVLLMLPSPSRIVVCFPDWYDSSELSYQMIVSAHSVNLGFWKKATDLWLPVIYILL